jgi:hypothetical protein
VFTDVDPSSELAQTEVFGPVLAITKFSTDEEAIAIALYRFRAILPTTPEGVATLGMIDIDEGVDEDYLVPSRARAGPAVLVQGMARQPIRWVATHLRQHGAMVASGILTGYAGRFAAHILKHRPTLTSALTKVTRAAGDENRLSVDMYRAMPRSSMRSLRWWPPMFPQRAFPVYRCGWKGLHTARAVARISASCLPVIGSIRQHQTEPESQRATARMVEPVDFDLANLECDAFDVSRNLRRGRPSLV